MEAESLGSFLISEFYTKTPWWSEHLQLLGSESNPFMIKAALIILQSRKTLDLNLSLALYFYLYFLKHVSLQDSDIISPKQSLNFSHIYHVCFYFCLSLAVL